MTLSWSSKGKKSTLDRGGPIADEKPLPGLSQKNVFADERYLVGLL